MYVCMSCVTELCVCSGLIITIIVTTIECYIRFNVIDPFLREK